MGTTTARPRAVPGPGLDIPGIRCVRDHPHDVGPAQHSDQAAAGLEDGDGVDLLVEHGRGRGVHRGGRRDVDRVQRDEVGDDATGPSQVPQDRGRDQLRGQQAEEPSVGVDDDQVTQPGDHDRVHRDADCAVRAYGEYAWRHVLAHGDRDAHGLDVRRIELTEVCAEPGRAGLGRLQLASLAHQRSRRFGQGDHRDRAGGVLDHRGRYRPEHQSGRGSAAMCAEDQHVHPPASVDQPVSR